MTTSQEKTAIRIENMTKRYRDQVALDGLSLDVPEGSVFGLLGENGAGKTTTLQILLGLVAPDSGGAEVLGLNPVRQGLDIRRRVGYVPEQPALYEWMTVAEIGWFAAGFHPGRARASPPIRRVMPATQGSLCPRIERSSSSPRECKPRWRWRWRWRRAAVADSRRAHLGPRRAGSPRVPGKHGRPGRQRADGAAVEPSDRRGGAGGRHVAFLHQGKLILAEPLDELKARTFLLALTFTSRDHPAAPTANLPVELIDAADAPCQAHWLVRARDRAAAEAVRTLPGVESLQVETPGLEDIYIGYMRGRRPQPALPRAAANVA